MKMRNLVLSLGLLTVCMQPIVMNANCSDSCSTDYCRDCCCSTGCSDDCCPDTCCQSCSSTDCCQDAQQNCSDSCSEENCCDPCCSTCCCDCYDTCCDPCCSKYIPVAVFDYAEFLNKWPKMYAMSGKRIRAAIKEVADSRGILIVFYKNSFGFPKKSKIAFCDPECDITQEVIDRLLPDKKISR